MIGDGVGDGVWMAIYDWGLTIANFYYGYRLGMGIGDEDKGLQYRG